MRLFIHHLSFIIHHSPFTIQNSSFNIHHSPFNIHHSPFTIHHSTFNIHHSPFTIHHSPFTIHHSPFIIHHSPFIIKFMPFIFLCLLLLATATCTVANEDQLGTPPTPLKPSEPIEIPKVVPFDSQTQERLIRIIRRHHYMRPAISEIEGAFFDPESLNSYLKTLDPYSKYIKSARQAYYQKRQAKEQIGLGINILVNQKALLAVPLQNSPAWQAGFQSPAYLVTVDDKKLSANDFSSFSFLVDLLPGQKIPLRVSNREPLDITEQYTVTINSFNNTSIEYLTIANRKVIRIHAFDSRGMTKKLANFLKTAMQQTDDIIIDLRYCPGGSLFEAIDAVSLFVPAELEVSYLKKQYQKRLRPLTSLPGKITQHQNIYIWVSQFTASAAEVFARILQHYANATVVGTPTAGKCLSQQQFQFEDGSALQLSVFEILDPEQQTCQGNSLKLDVPIEPDNMLNSHDYLAKSE
jgi:C-terminal peptidase prc